jgi:flagellar biosynthesis/type III secretory pathway ATPase
VAGSDAAIDDAQRLIGPLRSFLTQTADESSTLEESNAALASALEGPA